MNPLMSNPNSEKRCYYTRSKTRLTIQETEITEIHQSTQLSPAHSLSDTLLASSHERLAVNEEAEVSQLTTMSNMDYASPNDTIDPSLLSNATTPPEADSPPMDATYPYADPFVTPSRNPGTPGFHPKPLNNRGGVHGGNSFNLAAAHIGMYNAKFEAIHLLLPKE